MEVIAAAPFPKSASREELRSLKTQLMRTEFVAGSKRTRAFVVDLAGSKLTAESNTATIALVVAELHFKKLITVAWVGAFSTAIESVEAFGTVAINKGASGIVADQVA